MTPGVSNTELPALGHQLEPSVTACCSLVASGKEVMGLAGALLGLLKRIPAETQGLGGTAPSLGCFPGELAMEKNSSSLGRLQPFPALPRQH